MVEESFIKDEVFVEKIVSKELSHEQVQTMLLMDIRKILLAFIGTRKGK